MTLADVDLAKRSKDLTQFILAHGIGQVTHIDIMLFSCFALVLCLYPCTAKALVVCPLLSSLKRYDRLPTRKTRAIPRPGRYPPQKVLTLQQGTVA